MRLRHSLLARILAAGLLILSTAVSGFAETAAPLNPSSVTFSFVYNGVTVISTTTSYGAFWGPMNLTDSDGDVWQFFAELFQSELDFVFTPVSGTNKTIEPFTMKLGDLGPNLVTGVTGLPPYPFTLAFTRTTVTTTNPSPLLATSGIVTAFSWTRARN